VSLRASLTERREGVLEALPGAAASLRERLVHQARIESLPLMALVERDSARRLSG
jgi:hypothetical protein